MFDITWRDAAGWASNGRDLAVPPAPPDRPVERASMLLWSEHCVECVAPQCYATCGLYVRRADGRCARFAYGIQPNRLVNGLFDYGADITFRRWAKLEARWTSSPQLFPVSALRRRGAFVRRAAAAWRAVEWLAKPFDGRGRVRRKFGSFVRSYQKRRFERKEEGDGPDALYVKFFNPGARRVLDFELTRENVPIYRTSFAAAQGWNEHLLPFRDVPSQPPRQRGHARFWLEGDEPARLIFTWLDFVSLPRTAPAAAPPAPKLKCVAWDLDGTVWDGVLAEAGPDHVKPRPHVAEIVRKLDERGILQTIASKNDHEPAWTALQRHGLAEYFLHPAIHWGPKSASLREVAKRLNIDVNAFALVDDSAYERAEVAASLPQVRVFETADGLLERAEFDVPITPEARARRHMYLQESRRAEVASAWSGNHEGFLRDCGMVMRIGPPVADQRERCHELLERTNQFNLSGRRTSMKELSEALEGGRHDALAIRVHDRFGDYGIVGFAQADLDAECPVLGEFVLSCRVAGKTIEDTFLLWYAQRVRARGARRLRIRFNATTRNTPLKEALERLPLAKVSEEGAVSVLEMDLREPVRVPTVVTVEEAASAVSTARP